jgi:RNA polymerase sigma-70 factor, ECF subfamily
MMQIDYPAREYDRSLVARIARRDRCALAALYDRYRASLFTYCCCLMPEPESAEELLQDTLVGVWQGAGGYTGQAPVWAWVRGIARRQAHNARRRSRPPCADGEVLEMLESTDPGPEEVTLDRAGCTEIAEAITTLSPIHQEILRMIFVQGLSYSELAGALGIPDGTVKSRLSLARRALRAALSGREEPR